MIPARTIAHVSDADVRRLALQDLRKRALDAWLAAPSQPARTVADAMATTGPLT